MTQEPAPTILEFGPASGPPDPSGPSGAPPPRRRRNGLAQWLTGARLDTRVLPFIAGLGAAAVFASLLTRWQTSALEVVVGGRVINETGREYIAMLSDTGGWGAGYLVGLFAVATSASLVLFGAPAARGHARVAGLGAAVALLAILAAAAADMNGRAIAIPSWVYVGESEVSFNNSYGPGVYLAFAGVATLGLALYLAGRLPGPASADGLPRSEAELTTEDLSRWRRRPETGDADAGAPPPPADLTVQPTSPFVHVPQP